MNRTQYIAHGGMLTALSVLLLYLACILPMVRIGLCAAGGIVPAVPMAKRRVKLAVTVYIVTSVLSAVILPQKGVALLYTLVFGLYTLVKYSIEKRMHRFLGQWVCKVLFAAADGALIWFLLQAGLLAITGSMLGVVVTNISWYMILGFIIGWFAVFAVYDIAFSRLTRQLRRVFPED